MNSVKAAETKDIELIVSIDVETLGPNIHRNIITEIGYAIIRVSDGVVVDLYATFIPYREGTTSDQRCLGSFWLKRDDTGGFPLLRRLEESMQGIRQAPHHAMSALVKRLRHFTNGKKVQLITDTAGFDASWINYYLPIPAEGSEDPPSVDFLFLDENGRTYYNPPLQVTPFFKGVGWRYPTSSPFLSACMALGIPPRSFGVKHDHHAENDALLLGLRYMYILSHIQQMTSREVVGTDSYPESTDCNPPQTLHN